ncbi:response regulator transcription factor [Ochrobactrum sp. MR28]|jgi:DNA-binding NarL/FixJ family response regulator|nr:response regulator transcription factor [Ochrobactrum sp. MR28]MBX8818182.1 response regulator transcription factor [Ochrobactrum sp. MR31]MDR2310135.1 response regulator transcription factor [Brucellaceae bacterium]
MTDRFRGTNGRALVMCVEDEKYIREELVRELKRSGHDVVEASDGAAALALLKKQIPDLIISDILMPEMDGLELLGQVRSGTAELSAIPFLFLSALADRDRILAAYRAGVDDYLVKPVDMGVFLTQVDAKLRLVQRIENRKQNATPGVNAKKLSPREINVLVHLVDGKKSADIALALQLSDHTVNDYIKSIFKKLNVHSRAEAVKEAVKNKIVEP